MRHCIIFFLVFTSLMGNAQDLNRFFSQIRLGHSPNYKTLSPSIQTMPELDRLIIFTGDTLPRIRYYAYQIIGAVSKSPGIETEIQNAAIDALIQGWEDREPSVTELIASQLSDLAPHSFSPMQKAVLSDLLHIDVPRLDLLAKLIGYLQIQEAENTMISLLQMHPTMDSSDRWALHLALARLGEKRALDFVSRKAKGFPINDDWVYEIVPSLVYVRQKQVFDLLLEAIVNDLETCSPADAEISGQISCSYRIIELVAPFIKNFPLEVDEFGEIIIDNYPESLKIAQQWIVAHRADYELDHTKY